MFSVHKDFSSTAIYSYERETNLFARHDWIERSKLRGESMHARFQRGKATGIVESQRRV